MTPDAPVSLLAKASSRSPEIDDRVVEKKIRESLGIPSDANQVLVFTESSHWDPNWMLTSEGYYRLRVKRNLDQVIGELLAQPRRVYSVECAFFIRMYFERNPDKQDTVRELINSGRLRLMGCGVTTPDTLIPTEESLIRDYLEGQQWLLDNGILVEPDLAYFPDSFGHTPGMASLMTAIGVANVAICRIDGQFFLGCETESPRKYPRPGTSAHLLSKIEKSQDFIWTSSDGSKVLAHWVAFGYGQGELLAHSGLTRVAGAPLAVPNRAPAHVAGRIARYTRQLTRHARTPYLLCPIGFDFSAPIPRLVDLLDRYNKTYYPDTGVWVINAGLDDYFALVGTHRDKLPEIPLDPNPYFSGFLASRPTLKQNARLLTDQLIDHDARAVMDSLEPDNQPGETGQHVDLPANSYDPRWILATSNHHDFITGTSPHRVYRKEQAPWLARAIDQLATSGTEVSPNHGQNPKGNSKKTSSKAGSDARVDRAGTLVTVEIPNWGEAIFDEKRGGCLVSLKSASAKELLGDFENFDVISYDDHGGLWRMGMEFRGGKFAQVARSSKGKATVEVDQDELRPGQLRVTSTSTLAGHRLVTIYHLGLRTPGTNLMVLGFSCTSKAPTGRTITCRVGLTQDLSSFTMDCPGEVVERASKNHFDPTFWPVQSFADFRSGAGPGVSTILGRSTAICLHSKGSGSRFAKRLLGDIQAESVAEIVMMRNAPKERYLGFIPIPGFPARGHDGGPCTFEMSLVFSEDGTWKENGLFGLSHKHLAGRGHDSVRSYVATSQPTILPMTLKKATRGDGYIIRLRSFESAPKRVTVSLEGHPITQAIMCDARERDLGPALVQAGAVELECSQAITTLRVLF